MLKYKLIRAYVAIWCVVCLLYVGARAAFGVVAGGPGEETKTTEATESTEKEDAVPTPNEPTGQTQNGGRESSSNDQGISSESTETVHAPVETTSPVSTNAPSEGTGQSQQTQETQVTEQQQSAPSLSEYLSQFTCGNCRRNCSLDHPRCHNGSRLAELKAQEYYETYGA